MDPEQYKQFLAQFAQHQNAFANQAQYGNQNQFNPFQPQIQQQLFNPSQIPYVPRMATPPSTPQYPDLDFISETIPTPEFVPETQEATKKPKQRDRKKKAKQGEGPSSAPRDLHKWTEFETELLVKCWVEKSECAIIGADQTFDALWVRIGELFFEKMGKGEYLSLDQLSSKFGHINRKVKKFNGIFQGCQRTRKSGAGDGDVLKVALDRYKLIEGGAAPLSLWTALAKSPKWQRLHASDDHVSSRKRDSSEMSGSPGLSDAASPFVGESNEFDDELPRPIGKKKAKAIAKGQASGSAVDEQTAIGRDLVEEIRQFNLAEKEKIDLRILNMDLSKLGPRARKYYEKKQKQIEDALEVSDESE